MRVYANGRAGCLKSNWLMGSNPSARTKQRRLVLTTLVDELTGRRKVRDHKCSKCGKKEPEVTFGTKKLKGEVRYQHHLCHPCQAEYRRGLNFNKESQRRMMKKRTDKRKEQRRLGLDTARFIFHDTRKSDKKRGLGNDLDYQFVASAISTGCSYCGDTTLRMTLDRIDNTLGHLKSNVLPACIRCNFMRRDMPIEAWMVLVPAVTKAREEGLFGKWTGSIKRASSQAGKASACKADNQGFDPLLALQV